LKKLDNVFILFRFYEIPQRDRADKINLYEFPERGEGQRPAQ
jgi:hypothetical protein